MSRHMGSATTATHMWRSVWRHSDAAGAISETAAGVSRRAADAAAVVRRRHSGRIYAAQRAASFVSPVVGAVNGACFVDPWLAARSAWSCDSPNAPAAAAASGGTCTAPGDSGTTIGGAGVASGGSGGDGTPKDAATPFETPAARHAAIAERVASCFTAWNRMAFGNVAVTHILGSVLRRSPSGAGYHPTRAVESRGVDTEVADRCLVMAVKGDAMNLPPFERLCALFAAAETMQSVAAMGVTVEVDSSASKSHHAVETHDNFDHATTDWKLDETGLRNSTRCHIFNGVAVAFPEVCTALRDFAACAHAWLVAAAEGTNNDDAAIRMTSSVPFNFHAFPACNEATFRDTLLWLAFDVLKFPVNARFARDAPALCVLKAMTQIQPMSAVAQTLRNRHALAAVAHCLAACRLDPIRGAFLKDTTEVEDASVPGSTSAPAADRDALRENAQFVADFCVAVAQTSTVAAVAAMVQEMRLSSADAFKALDMSARLGATELRGGWRRPRQTSVRSLDGGAWDMSVARSVVQTAAGDGHGGGGNGIGGAPARHPLADDRVYERAAVSPTTPWMPSLISSTIVHADQQAVATFLTAALATISAAAQFGDVVVVDVGLQEPRLTDRTAVIAVCRVAAPCMAFFTDSRGLLERETATSRHPQRDETLCALRERLVTFEAVLTPTVARLLKFIINEATGEAQRLQRKSTELNGPEPVARNTEHTVNTTSSSPKKLVASVDSVFWVAAVEFVATAEARGFSGDAAALLAVLSGPPRRQSHVHGTSAAAAVSGAFSVDSFLSSSAADSDEQTSLNGNSVSPYRDGFEAQVKATSPLGQMRLMESEWVRLLEVILQLPQNPPSQLPGVPLTCGPAASMLLDYAVDVLLQGTLGSNSGGSSAATVVPHDTLSAAGLTPLLRALTLWGRFETAAAGAPLGGGHTKSRTSEWTPRQRHWRAVATALLDTRDATATITADPEAAYPVSERLVLRIAECCHILTEDYLRGGGGGRHHHRPHRRPFNSGDFLGTSSSSATATAAPETETAFSSQRRTFFTTASGGTLGLSFSGPNAFAEETPNTTEKEHEAASPLIDADDELLAGIAATDVDAELVSTDSTAVEEERLGLDDAGGPSATPPAGIELTAIGGGEAAPVPGLYPTVTALRPRLAPALLMALWQFQRAVVPPQAAALHDCLSGRAHAISLLAADAVGGRRVGLAPMSVLDSATFAARLLDEIIAASPARLLSTSPAPSHAPAQHYRLASTATSYHRFYGGEPHLRWAELLEDPTFVAHASRAVDPMLLALLESRVSLLRYASADGAESAASSLGESSRPASDSSALAGTARIATVPPNLLLPVTRFLTLAAAIARRRRGVERAEAVQAELAQLRRRMLIRGGLASTSNGPTGVTTSLSGSSAAIAASNAAGLLRNDPQDPNNSIANIDPSLPLALPSPELLAVHPPPSHPDDWAATPAEDTRAASVWNAFSCRAPQAVWTSRMDRGTDSWFLPLRDEELPASAPSLPATPWNSSNGAEFLLLRDPLVAAAFFGPRALDSVDAPTPSQLAHETDLDVCLTAMSGGRHHDRENGTAAGLHARSMSVVGRGAGQAAKVDALLAIEALTTAHHDAVDRLTLEELVALAEDATATFRRHQQHALLLGVAGTRSTPSSNIDCSNMGAAAAVFAPLEPFLAGVWARCLEAAPLAPLRLIARVVALRQHLAAWGVGVTSGGSSLTGSAPTIAHAAPVVESHLQIGDLLPDPASTSTSQAAAGVDDRGCDAFPVSGGPSVLGPLSMITGTPPQATAGALETALTQRVADLIVAL